MTRVVTSAFIAHPVEAVFRVASHPEEQLRWDRESLIRVERLSSAPLGRGARYRLHFRGAGPVDVEFLDFDPPRRYTHLTRIPFGRMRHLFAFESEDGGTRLHQEAELDLAPLARLAGPLYSWVLGRRFRRLAEAVRRDLDERSATGSSEGGMA